MPRKKPRAHARHLANTRRLAGAMLDADIANGIRAICALLQKRTGHDFSGYKEATLIRRIRRRVHVRRAASASDYLQILERDPVEPEHLLNDLLIGVTQFFRDPATFAKLEREVLPRILEGEPADAPVRIWVPGCASGEEAYSIAMLVYEHLAPEAGRLVQIFATDIDAAMIAKARAGRYSAEIEERVSPEQLERYFVRDGKTWQVNKVLRDACIFSVHSLVRDPPFSALNLISCRNVLIYLEPHLQKKIVQLFHYALCRGGYLLLGPAEGLVDHSDLFEPVDKKHRIFRRHDTVARPQVSFPISPGSASRTSEAPSPLPPLHAKATTAIERLLLDQYAPPCAVVNEHGEIQFVAGRIGRFLAPPAGEPTTHLLDAVRDSLRVELRTALHSAASTGARVVREGIPVELDDAMHRVRLTVRPVPGASGLFAVVVQERALEEVERLEATVGSLVPHVPPALDQLEDELRATRANLREAVESAEAANEELRSANEELVSTNEELQSTNEELQTSQEELQFVNEELETVNAELNRKVEELGTANSDLQNLFASTEIATIFLDRDLRITRFTPAATGLLRLVETDLGRSIGDFAPRFDRQDLVADAHEVLRTRKPMERQVRANDGAWFILRLLPYRTVENVIAGVVVTFVDVSDLKRAEEALRQSEERFRLMVEGVKDYAIFMLDPDGTVVSWNAGAERLKGYRGEEIIGRHFSRFYSDEEVRAGTPQRLLEAAAAQGRAEDEGWRMRKDGSRFWGSILITAIRDESGNLRGFAEVSRDFTARKAMEARLAYLASFPEGNPGPIVEEGLDGRVRYANAAALRLFPDIRERGSAHPWLSDVETVARSIREGSATPHVRVVTVGDRIHHQVLVYPPEEGVVRIYGTDITERTRVEYALKKSEAKYRNLFQNMAEEVHFWELVRDGEGHIETWRLVDANPPALRTWGKALEEIKGKTTDEIFGPGATTHFMPVVQKIMTEGVPYSFEDYFPNLDKHFRFTSIPLGDHFITTGADITGIKKALRQAEEQRAQLEAVFQAVQDGITVSDVSGKLLLMNEAEARINGYANVGEMHRHVADLARVHELRLPDGTLLPIEQWPVSRVLRGESIVDVELHARRKDTGQEWFASFTGEPVCDSQGRQSIAVVVTRDITRRKQAEEGLLRSRQGLSRLAEATLRVVRETDLQRMLHAISEAALALTDARIAACGHGDVSGRSLVEGSARTPDAPACPPGNMFRMEKGGVYVDLLDGADAIRLTDTELRAHLRWRGAPAGHVPLRGLLGVRMAGRDGRTNGMILVTDKREGEFAEEHESLLRQLATIASLALQHVEARISLEESDRSKNEFLAMLSHELRNPLAPIRNSLYILDRAAPGGEQARHAQTVIDRQVVQLTRLVDDLLDVTRISRGKIQLRRERLDLCHVVRRAIEDHRSVFAQNALELQVAVPDVSLWIDGDRTRIAQVIGNLLHNSAKFTEPGGQVAVSVEGNESLRRATVRIRDTGVGIGPEMLPRVFEPFTQADTTLDRSKGGLGLGLALVKGLVEMHGGVVTVESEGLGKGAEFVVSLPLERAELAAAAPWDRALDDRPRRVLVIEDNKDAAESLRELLELEHHTVEVAFSGAEGIEKARSFRPDVVLCDIGLPGMDGHAVARAMRADPALRGARLVALTGYAAPEDIVRSREAGFHSHVAKPPTLETLEEALTGGAMAGSSSPGSRA